jgi:hypothetical protein
MGEYNGFACKDGGQCKQEVIISQAAEQIKEKFQ